MADKDTLYACFREKFSKQDIDQCLEEYDGNVNACFEYFLKLIEEMNIEETEEDDVIDGDISNLFPLVNSAVLRVLMDILGEFVLCDWQPGQLTEEGYLLDVDQTVLQAHAYKNQQSDEDFARELQTESSVIGVPGKVPSLTSLFKRGMSLDNILKQYLEKGHSICYEDISLLKDAYDKSVMPVHDNRKYSDVASMLPKPQKENVVIYKYNSVSSSNNNVPPHENTSIPRNTQTQLYPISEYNNAKDENLLRLLTIDIAAPFLSWSEMSQFHTDSTYFIGTLQYYLFAECLLSSHICNRELLSLIPESVLRRGLELIKQEQKELSMQSISKTHKNPFPGLSKIDKLHKQQFLQSRLHLWLMIQSLDIYCTEPILETGRLDLHKQGTINATNQVRSIVEFLQVVKDVQKGKPCMHDYPVDIYSLPKVPTTLQVVVGKGIHSSGSMLKLRKAVRTALEELHEIPLFQNRSLQASENDATITIKLCE